MPHLTLRVPTELLAKVETYQAAVEEQTGIPVKRADALRAALETGVDAKLKELGKKARGTQ